MPAGSPIVSKTDTWSVKVEGEIREEWIGFTGSKDSEKKWADQAIVIVGGTSGVGCVLVRECVTLGMYVIILNAENVIA